MIDLSWKDEYYIKNDRINKQHKNLFTIAKEAFAVVSPDKKLKK